MSDGPVALPAQRGRRAVPSATAASGWAAAPTRPAPQLAVPARRRRRRARTWRPPPAASCAEETGRPLGHLAGPHRRLARLRLPRRPRRRQGAAAGRARSRCGSPSASTARTPRSTCRPRPPEFDAWRWGYLDETPELVVPFKRPPTRRWSRPSAPSPPAAAAFKQQACRRPMSPRTPSSWCTAPSAAAGPSSIPRAVRGGRPQVLAPDLRGHATDNPPGRAGVSMTDYAADIAPLCARTARRRRCCSAIPWAAWSPSWRRAGRGCGPWSCSRPRRPGASPGSSFEEAATAFGVQMLGPFWLRRVSPTAA